jgi:hypothetical protein
MGTPYPKSSFRTPDHGLQFWQEQARSGSGFGETRTRFVAALSAIAGLGARPDGSRPRSPPRHYRVETGPWHRGPAPGAHHGSNKLGSW